MQSLLGRNRSSEQLAVEPQTLHGYDMKTRSPPAWKPFTLTRTFLILVTIITISLIVGLGALLWQSSKYGGIFFTSTAEPFTYSQIFCFQYLPVVLNVLYSLIWNWLDLDVKRLEPWYQLANLKGSSPSDSILLQYPSTFFAWVPFKAARSRHWIVFVVAMSSAVVAWVVTPLQNGVFTTRSLTQNQTIAVSEPYGLAPLDQQSHIMTAKFMRDASSILWLGQKLPSFTTREYALAPVSISRLPEGSNQTFQVNTILYDTDLNCQTPANYSFSPASVVFDDGRGCIFQGYNPFDTEATYDYTSHYIGYWDSARLDFSLEIAGCPESAAHTILLIWATTVGSGLKQPDHQTSLFCQTAYYSQGVTATISGPDFAVVEVTRSGPRIPLTEAQFNQTHFETTMNLGALQFVDAPDLMDQVRLHQDGFVSNMSLNAPVDTMTGFAVGSTHLQPEAYLDATTMVNAYQDAHRLSFALALQSLMQPPTDSETSTAPSSTVQKVVAVVPIFTILAQGFLGLVVASLILLIFNAPSRPSRLSRDPDCISEVMKLARDPLLRESIRDADTTTLLNQANFGDASFTFDNEADHRDPKLVLYRNKILPQPPIGPVNDIVCVGRELVKPMEYQWYTGLGFVALLATLLIGLVTLNFKSMSEGGLPLPTTSAIGLQLLTNVLPTLVATSIEPIWIWLNRMACILAPLERLSRDMSPAEHSLMLTYAAIPPQIVAWRALKGRNYILTLLSCVAFTAGVLTIAISGVLVTDDVMAEHATSLTPLYPGDVDDSAFTSADTNDLSSAMIVTTSNLTNQTLLPAWTIPHYYFFPFDIQASLALTDIDHVNMIAIGHGVGVVCDELSSDPAAPNSYSLTFSKDLRSMDLTSQQQVNGSSVRCRAPTSVIGGDPTLNMSMEVAVRTLGLENALETSCHQQMIFGWMRTRSTFVPGTNDTSDEQVLNQTSLNSTFMACRMSVVQQPFNITVSPTGFIQAATQISNTSTEYTSITTKLNTTVDYLLRSFPDGNLMNTFEGWTNDSIPLKWPNYLQKIITNSTAHLDPNLPPPSFGGQAEIMKDIIRRTFATSLSISSYRYRSDPLSKDTPLTPARFYTRQRRIFVSRIPFQICVVILSIQLVVAILFFITRPEPFLKRIPTSIAAQIALFADSHVVDDALNASAAGDFRLLDKKGWRYGYGKILGSSGRACEGIERAPYVRALGHNNSSNNSNLLTSTGTDGNDLCRSNSETAQKPSFSSFVFRSRSRGSINRVPDEHVLENLIQTRSGPHYGLLR